jgi:hypothetical protein
VWAPGRAQYGYFQPTARLAFYVDENQDVAFLEPHGSTWSQVVARKAAR